MDKLVAIVYDDESRAAEVYALLQRLQNEALIEINDAVYVVKNNQGKVKLNQNSHMTGEGAVAGSFWGLLIGLLFFAPIAGLALGAGAGALLGKTSDYGIDDKFMKELSSRVKNGSSVLFISYKSVVTDKVVPQISKFGGHLLQTSLSRDAETKLQKSLNEGALKPYFG